MTDADEPGAVPAPTGTLPPEVQADVREALQQVADLFGGGAEGDHSIFERLQGLGHLNDPAVRDRLTAAMQALRTANLQGAGQGGPVVMDLRGTEAGQALREMLQGVTGGAMVQTVSTSPAQVFINGQQIDPAALSVPQPAAQIVEAAPAAADPIVQTPVAQASPIRPAAPPMQPSIVEDASGGGFFGWLTRLLNGR